MQFHDDDTLKLLRDSVTHHYEELRPLRKKRSQLLSVSAGTGYEHSENKDSKYQDILNLMRQAAEAMTLSMAANRPRFLVTANAVQNQAFADHFAHALNTYSEQMGLERILQECVRNAFYFLGIAKVCFGTSSANLMDDGDYVAPGQPFCASVSPSHFCYDTDATDWQYCSFMADRYRVRFQDLVVDQRFDSAVRNEIKENGPQSLRGSKETEWGRDTGGRDPAAEFEEFVFLTDVYLPRDGVIYTFPCDEGFTFTTDRPVYTQEWSGREQGPYHILNLGPIPDKTTPASPAQNLLLLHNLVNSLYRKLGDQAERQKQLMLGRKGAEDDADALRGAEDGDVILLTEPERIQSANYDGPNQQNFSFMLNALERFSEQGGNLRHKLGLTQSADTATQESMIGQNVSRVEGAYQQRFVEFVREIASELGRLLYEDEVTEIPMTQQVPGTDISFDDTWQGARQEGARQGDLKQYGLNIDPYSLPYRSPEDRLAQLDATVDRMMPALPLIQQQGGVFDVREYLKLRAKYIDAPELETIFKFQQPVEQEQQGGQHERTLAPNTNRQYEHISTGGGAGGDQNGALQAMMGAANQGNGVQPVGEM